MNATEILMLEHRLIEQVLACLERLADEAAASQVLDAASTRQVVEFMAGFADLCHHRKEEEFLFPLLERRGFVRGQGFTGTIMAEHDAGRDHLQRLVELVACVEAGRREAVADFVRETRAYLHLQREHIMKEDHGLFPMAEGALTAEDQRSLAASFAELDREGPAPGLQQRCLEIADGLARRLGIPRRDLMHRHDPEGCQGP